MDIIDRCRGLGLLCCIAVAFVAMPATSAEAETIEIVQRDSNEDRSDALTYEVAIMEGAGWRREAVERAINQVEAVYAQCGVRVAATQVCWLQTRNASKALDESEQAGLLAELSSKRPLAVFAGQTTTGDTAYSYLKSAPVASRGTAWITRNSHPSCVGVLLAHELGHIFLDTAKHSADPKNLMAYTCTHSNIAGFSPNTRLSEKQCRRLRATR